MQEQHMSPTDDSRERAGHEPGQALAEYAIILVTVSIAAITVMSSIGTTVISLYTRASTTFPGI